MNDAQGSVLSCRGLSKYYVQGDTRIDVLTDVALSLAAGESVAVLGTSGVGKSTLLHLLGGLDKATSGEVWINGKAVSSLGVRELGVHRNRNLGFVYQLHHLLPEFTVLENVMMPLLIAGTARAQSAEAACEILAHVGLEKRFLHKPAELSGGERQRTAIARALVTRPRCILADEPTGNLDRQTADKVYELFLQLKEETRASLVMVTHDEKLATRMQRVMVLSDGSLRQ